MAWDPKYKASGAGNWNPEYVGQPSKQPTPYEPGFNVGPPGVGLPGKDGISPTVTTEPIENGHRIRVEAANGAFTFDLFNGQQGDPGVGPVVDVTPIENGQRITITDTNGPHVLELFNGQKGIKGDDGFSPVASVEKIDNGYRITIVDAQQTQSFDLVNGDDGISPTIAVAPITGGHRVTITDASGTKSFDVLDGKDGGGSGGGTPGEDGGYYTPSVNGGVLSWTPSKADMPSVPSANVQGKQGDDGVSPTVAVSAISGGNRLTITDAESTKTVDILNGKQGDPGGDGYSPTATVTAIDGGHRVTITDKDGTKSFCVPDGSPGATGPNTVSTTTSTNITGILKGNGSTVEAAVPKTDYVPPVTAIDGNVVLFDGTGGIKDSGKTLDDLGGGLTEPKVFFIESSLTLNKNHYGNIVVCKRTGLSYKNQTFTIVVPTLANSEVGAEVHVVLMSTGEGQSVNIKSSSSSAKLMAGGKAGAASGQIIKAISTGNAGGGVTLRCAQFAADSDLYWYIANAEFVPIET